MADGVSLGVANLELGADLAPLRADLDRAEAEVASKVAQMQAMFDRLNVEVGKRFSVLGNVVGNGLQAPLAKSQASLGTWATAQEMSLARVRSAVGETDAAYVTMADTAEAAADLQVAASGRVVEAYGAQAAAAKAAADAQEAAAARSAVAREVLGGIGGDRGAAAGGSTYRLFTAGRQGATEVATGSAGIWGVRGPTPPPGSIANPIVVALEAGSRTPLGTLAAAIGEDSQGSGTQAAAAGNEKGGPGTIIAAAPADQRAAAPRGPVVAVGPEGRPEKPSEDALALAKAALESAITRSATPEAVLAKPTRVAVAETDEQTAKATGDAIADALATKATEGRSAGQSQAEADAIMADLLGKRLAPGQVAKTAPGYQEAYGRLGYDVAPRVPGGPARLYAPGGQPGTANYGASEEAAAIAASRGGGGSGGGGGIPPWLMGALWGHGGGGGGGYSGAGTGLLGHALFGAAGFGAGMGSLGSFAGFGPEHIVLTIGGIAGSGVAALGGGSLLAGGALGKAGVGMGSDVAVASSAIADTGSLYKNYEKLREAVAQYGKASTQAKEAQAELTENMKYTLSGTKGVAAELGLAEKVSALNVAWDKGTSGARVQFVGLAEQAVKFGSVYLPLVAHAAEQNFAATSKAIKPLFSWLEGPEGMGIFLQLENEFRNQIPTAMKALDEGFQFFAKTVAYTAPLTGGFLTKLDQFFTKWNSPSEFSVWEGEMNKLINDFRVWEAFVKALGGALVDLFDKDAHTGQGIVEELTLMLDKLREYEKSVKGGEEIHNLFVVHRKEVEELLQVLPPLIGAFSHIYLSVAPPLVEAVTDIAGAFAKLLDTIEKAGPLGTWALGLTVIAAKLKILVPLLTAMKAEMVGSAAATDANAGATTADAAAMGALADSEGIALAGGGGVMLRGASNLSAGERANAATNTAADAEAGGLGALLSKGTLLKGGLAGFIGLLGGSAIAGATGAKGTLGTSISAAGAGAGVGLVAGAEIGAIGGPLGAVLGAGIGASAPYVIKGLTDLFSTGTEKAVAAAHAQTSHLLGLDTGLLGPASTQHSAAALSKALSAPAIVTAREAERYKGTTGESAKEQLKLDQAAAPAYRKAGEVAGKAYIEGAEHVRFQTRLGFLVSMEQHLEALPAAARSSAAKTMLAYAQKLESEGRLPQGVVAGFVTALESKVTGLTAYLVKEGAASAHALQKGYELTEARNTLKNSLVNIEQLFGVHFADTSAGVEKALGFLNTVVRNNKGPLGEAAKEMASALKDGLEVEWIAAKETNAREIGKLNAEFNSELKALGAPEIKALIGPSAPGGGVSGTPFGGGTPSGAPLKGGLGAAGGAMLQIGRPGEAGHDTVGMSVNGMGIRVAPGEVVGVFNRHQVPIVNAGLGMMGYDGMSGLFSDVTTPNYMAAGGLIPDVVHAGLADVRKAGKAKVGKASASAHASRAGAGPAGGGPPASSNEALGRKMMIEAGFPASEWGYLQKLWQKESGWSSTAVNPSSGAAGIAQSLGHGAVALGDAAGQIAWGLNYIKGRYGSPAAAWAHEMANNWYGRGGVLGFAGGGLLGFSGGGVAKGKPASGRRKKAKASPKVVQAWKLHPFGHIPSLKQLPEPYQQQLGSLNSLMETELPRLEEEYGLMSEHDQFNLSSAPHGGEFIITPTATEKLAGVTLPWEDTSNVGLRLGQLDELRAFQEGIYSHLNSALGMIDPITAGTILAIGERKKAIEKIRAQIKKLRKELAAKLKKLRDEIKANLAHLASLEHQLTAVGNPTKANNATRAHLKAEINKLKADNKHKGGSETEVGTGGEIESDTKSTEGQLKKLEGNASTLQSQQKELEERHTLMRTDYTSIAGLSGKGGSLGTAHLKVEELNQQITELGGTPTKLKEAILEAGSGPESALELAERQKAQAEEKNKLLREELKVSNTALSVFGGSGDIGSGGKNAFLAALSGGGLVPLPYAGSFDVGGVVDAPVGAARVAVVHGQEEILTPEQRRGGTSVVIHQKNEMMHPSDPDVLMGVGKATVRGMRLQGYRQSKRINPGI